MECRKFADRCAAAGFLVVVPDFFYGDPIDANNFDKIDRDAWRKLHSPVSLFSWCKIPDIILEAKWSVISLFALTLHNCTLGQRI